MNRSSFAAASLVATLSIVLIAARAHAGTVAVPTATLPIAITVGPEPVNDVAVAFEYNVTGGSTVSEVQFFGDLDAFEVATFTPQVFNPAFNGFVRYTVLGVFDDAILTLRGGDQGTVTVGVSPLLPGVALADFEAAFPNSPVDEAGLEMALESGGAGSQTLLAFFDAGDFGTTVPGAANLYNFADGMTAMLNGAAVAVPEPTTLSLGLAAASLLRRRRRA